MATLNVRPPVPPPTLRTRCDSITRPPLDTRDARGPTQEYPASELQPPRKDGRASTPHHHTFPLKQLAVMSPIERLIKGNLQKQRETFPYLDREHISGKLSAFFIAGLENVRPHAEVDPVLWYHRVDDG